VKVDISGCVDSLFALERLRDKDGIRMYSEGPRKGPALGD